MSHTTFVNVPDELKLAHRASVEQRDRFILGVCQGHKRKPPKAEKKRLRDVSLFRYFAEFWRELTPTQKTAWGTAAALSGLSNWQLFVSDNAARLRDSLPLNVPPSDLWQVRAGYIVIESPASKMLLRQDHPLDYWVERKVVGASWKNELVRITETFSLPIDLTIRYKSDLTATGAEQRARLYAKVWTSYQGKDIYTPLALDFSASADWTELSATLSTTYGYIVGYTLYLDIFGYTGTLLFDNLSVIHGGTNWARDPRCDDISKTFSKAFALVPPFWVPEDVPVGASFSSVFPPALS